MCLPAFPQAGTLSADDQKFLETAAQTDMLEAHLGQMAADQAAGSDIKDFAQMMVTDHTADYKQLGTLGTKIGGTVPKGLDPAHDKMIAPYEKLKAKAFDRKYAMDMVAGHTKALAAYKKESTDGQNADLKAYATQTIPTLEKHLDAAKQLGKPAAGGKKTAS